MCNREKPPGRGRIANTLSYLIIFSSAYAILVNHMAQILYTRYHKTALVRSHPESGVLEPLQHLVQARYELVFITSRDEEPDIQGKVRIEQEKQVEYHKSKHVRTRAVFKCGQTVWARQFQKGRTASWCPAVVLRCCHPLYWVRMVHFCYVPAYGFLVFTGFGIFLVNTI